MRESHSDQFFLFKLEHKKKNQKTQPLDIDEEWYHLLLDLYI